MRDVSRGLQTLAQIQDGTVQQGGNRTAVVEAADLAVETLIHVVGRLDDAPKLGLDLLDARLGADVGRRAALTLGAARCCLTGRSLRIYEGEV